jgi:glyoxylase-like metal-dependent hydrolase (beta-lactamase superfamily II)
MITTTEYGDVLRFDLARTIAGRGRYWTTAYFVDGIMVDTGCAHTSGELESALMERSLDRIINTHSHEDHIGGNGPVQRQRPGLEILAHPLALPVLKNPAKMQPLQPYRKFFWGWPEPCEANPISDGAVIETNQYTFRAIYTPGHSEDHLCLYEPQEGWLFTGDLFVGGKDRALRKDYNIWQIITSLKSIKGLHLRKLFPGCASVREEPQQSLEDKIAYLEDLGGRVLELHKSGWKVSAIARELLGGPMWVEIVTLGHFSRRQLVLSYLQMKTVDVDDPYPDKSGG